MRRRPGKALSRAAGLVAALAAFAGCTDAGCGAPPPARRAVHGGCWLAEGFELDPLRAFELRSFAEQAVAAGAPIAGGDLPQDALDELTRGAADAVRRCYAEQLGWDRSAGGQLLLAFRSVPPVSRVEASGTASDYVRACAAAAVPPIEPTRDASVTLAFTLTPPLPESIDALPALTIVPDKVPAGTAADLAAVDRAVARALPALEKCGGGITDPHVELEIRASVGGRKTRSVAVESSYAHVSGPGVKKPSAIPGDARSCLARAVSAIRVDTDASLDVQCRVALESAPGPADRRARWSAMPVPPPDLGVSHATVVVEGEAAMRGDRLVALLEEADAAADHFVLEQPGGTRATITYANDFAASTWRRLPLPAPPTTLLATADRRLWVVEGNGSKWWIAPRGTDLDLETLGTLLTSLRRETVAHRTDLVVVATDTLALADVIAIARVAQSSGLVDVGITSWTNVTAWGWIR